MSLVPNQTQTEMTLFFSVVLSSQHDNDSTYVMICTKMYFYFLFMDNMHLYTVYTSKNTRPLTCCSFECLFTIAAFAYQPPRFKIQGAHDVKHVVEAHLDAARCCAKMLSFYHAMSEKRRTNDANMNLGVHCAEKKPMFHQHELSRILWCYPTSMHFEGPERSHGPSLCVTVAALGVIPLS